jgi:putative ABC transport system substrate-binding protein
MQRREFVAFFGSAAAVWPLAARAQQQPTTPVIGFLHSASPRPYGPMVAAFRRGLSETGYIEGRNVIVRF